jgi:hypothetical protein
MSNNTHCACLTRDMIMGKDVLRNYKDGFPIFLHILARYKFLGADVEREGLYMGVFRLERSGGYSPDIEAMGRMSMGVK